MCNQSAHNPCIAKLFQIEEQDLLDLSPEEIKARMNPCKIPGMHYMCKECEERTIPSDDVGKLKKPGNKSDHPVLEQNLSSTPAPQHNATQNAVEIVDDHDSHANISTQNCPQHPQTNQAPRSNVNFDQTRTVNNNRLSASTPRPLCPHYKRGICRHGISGRSNGGCSKAHPKACPKLLQFGIRGPRGCTGVNCNRFHPRMCTHPYNLDNA